ncbi:hypothetical protein R1sor_010149 [Riccia sorocarpa]|uniref:DUF7794 domain-containing protein n=1 Tax=Riccia sorocarpa TaxID=122646 RepID=A0ABD3HX99_9MARC
MANFASLLWVTALAMTVFLAPTVFAGFKEENAGRVLFVEKAQQEFLRESISSSGIEESFSPEDIAASVSVLLGVPPPLTLSSASSAKLDSVLTPNPFRRPRSVLTLTVRGIDFDLLSAAEREAIFGTSTVQQRLSVGNRGQFILPGYGVEVVSLEKHHEGLKQGLKDLSDFLGGALVEDENDVVVLTVPLVESVSISLDLSKEADLKFVNDVLSVYDIVKGASQASKSIAKLYTGSLSGVEAMDNNVNAAKILLLTAVKVANEGQTVAVFMFPPSSSDSEQDMMFFVSPPVRSRSLDEVNQEATAPSSSDDLTSLDNIIIELEVIALVRGSLVVATSLILLVAILLGTCYLVGMPVTRDTLLYSGVKLD